MTGEKFIQNLQCNLSGCIHNFQGKCVYEYSKLDLEDISEQKVFTCYNVACKEGYCLECGIKLKSYKEYHGIDNRFYEEIYYCPNCK